MKRKIILSFTIFVVLMLVISVVISGCARSRETDILDKTSSESAALPSETFAQTTQFTEGEVQEIGEEQQQPSSSSSVLAMQPKIIKSAFILIEIEKGTFNDKIIFLTNIAEKNNGFVSSTDSNSNPEGRITRGRILIRIPSDKFDSVIEEIKKIGNLKAINISGQDVTQEYVDLESRLKNYEAQEKVLLDLMAKAKSVKESIEVQRELSNVQGEIEVIKGRLNYLNNLISFSSIDVTITEPEEAAPIKGGGFINAVKRGAEGAIKVLNGITFFFIAISPILVVGGIIFLIVWGSLRAKNKRRTK